MLSGSERKRALALLQRALSVQVALAGSGVSLIALASEMESIAGELRELCPDGETADLVAQTRLLRELAQRLPPEAPDA